MSIGGITPPPAKVTVLSSIHGIGEAAWDAVIGATPSAQHGLLRTYERASTSGALPQYFVLGSIDRPFAVAIGQLARTARQYERITRPLLGRAQFLAPALVDLLGPILILGLRPMYGPPLLTDSHSDRESQRAHLRHLCSEIESYADEQGLTIAAVGITDRDQAVIEVLRDRGFNETLGYPTSELEVLWNSWDGYLEHLKPSRRQFIRKEVKIFEAAGCRIRALELGDPIPSELHDLYQQHHRRKNSVEAPYNSRLLSELQTNLASNARIYLAEHQNQLLGFLGVLWKDSVAGAPYVGIRSEVRARNMFVYFNLVFYQLARDAPELGLRKILYGTTVYRAKRLRGCSTIPTRLFIRPRRRLIRTFSAPAFEWHRRWYERKFSHLFTKSVSTMSSE